MLPGQVRNLHTNEIVGETDDVEAVFLDSVRKAAEQEACYVVIGTDSPEGFADRIRELGVPVVEEATLDSAALIVAGQPEEWASLRDEITPA